MRFDLALRAQANALKFGIVGSRTIGSRLRSHEQRFGPAEILSVWSVAEACDRLDELAYRLLAFHNAHQGIATITTVPLTPCGAY